MKKLIMIVALGFAAWHFYLKPPASPVISNIGANGAVLSNPIIEQPAPAFSLERFIPTFANNDTTLRSTSAAQSATTYRCDGRTHCSQMRSCEEATFFLRNCPGVKMDGNNDGVPCEAQWCR
ncbi:excalibur calcium-binding domain-containing protein [Phytopseudomonas punonensis]|uniref:Excalibur calcium-binding domain-containing protein n=1 Tax=Phytopseudomonas punonensis TaxID=1220495 RepID=A0A1M7P1W7_9GAMM|nr:excalibur calcium-binding domain-containing protein [Pseudomonas punonensis]SHN10405.1 Excalibur calcium-binding domain-containing protein [Pseudomonas punonensis]